MSELIGGLAGTIVIVLVLFLYTALIGAPIAIWIYCAKINKRLKMLTDHIARNEKS